MVTTPFEKLSAAFKTTPLPQAIVNICVGVFAPLTFLVPSGYGIAPALLFLLSLYYAPQLLKRDNLKQTGILGLSLLLFFTFYTLLVVYHQDGMAALDTPSRALLILLVLALFMQFPPSLHVFFYSFAFGGIIAGFYALYDVYVLKDHRAFVTIMPIQSGNISMVMGLFSVQGAFFCFSKGRSQAGYFCALGAFMGFTGSFLSLTRGGWLALIVSFIALFLHVKFAKPRFSRLYCFVCSLICIISISVSSVHIYHHSRATLDNLKNYTEHQEQPSSVGMRIELWQSYWQSFIEKPWMGWGLKDIRISQTQQWQAQELSDFMYAFKGHAHNQFLHALATQGILGGLTLLFLFLGPAYYFLQRLKENKNEQMQHGAMCGLILILAAGIFCLTQNFLSHHSGMLFYVTSLVFCAGVCEYRRCQV